MRAASNRRLRDRAGTPGAFVLSALVLPVVSLVLIGCGGSHELRQTSPAKQSATTAAAASKPASAARPAVSPLAVCVRQWNRDPRIGVGDPQRSVIVVRKGGAPARCSVYVISPSVDGFFACSYQDRAYVCPSHASMLSFLPKGLPKPNAQMRSSRGELALGAGVLSPASRSDRACIASWNMQPAQALRVVSFTSTLVELHGGVNPPYTCAVAVNFEGGGPETTCTYGNDGWNCQQSIGPINVNARLIDSAGHLAMTKQTRGSYSASTPTTSTSLIGVAPTTTASPLPASWQSCARQWNSTMAGTEGRTLYEAAYTAMGHEPVAAVGISPQGDCEVAIEVSHGVAAGFLAQPGADVFTPTGGVEMPSAPPWRFMGVRSNGTIGY